MIVITTVIYFFVICRIYTVNKKYLIKYLKCVIISHKLHILRINILSMTILNLYFCKYQNRLCVLLTRFLSNELISTYFFSFFFFLLLIYFSTSNNYDILNFFVILYLLIKYVRYLSHQKYLCTRLYDATAILIKPNLSRL